MTLKPTKNVKEYEKYGFKKCKGSYGKNGCYYLCVANKVIDEKMEGKR